MKLSEKPRKLGEIDICKRKVKLIWNVGVSKKCFCGSKLDPQDSTVDFQFSPLTPGILNILKTHFNSFRKSQSLLINISKRSRFVWWVGWFQNQLKMRKIPLEGVLSYLGKNYKKCLQGAFSTFFYLTAFSLPVSAIHFRQDFSRY